MAICIEAPFVLVGGKQVYLPDDSILNGTELFDFITRPESPGAAMLTDEPETFVDLPNGIGPESYPVPQQTPSQAAALESVVKRPTTPGQSAVAVKLPDGVTDATYSMKIGQTLQLRHFTIDCLFKYALPKSGHKGLSAEQIVTNLQTLTEKLADPVMSQFGPPGSGGTIINSGFRRKSDRSQHNIGRACDMQFAAGDYAANLAVAAWIQQSGLDFDQLLLEKATGWWVHMSYNADGNRNMTGIKNGAWQWDVNFV